MVNATYEGRHKGFFRNDMRQPLGGHRQLLIVPSTVYFNLFFDWDQLATIRQHRWKERIRISQVATMIK